MVAPEIVIIERGHSLANGNNAGASGIDSKGCHLAAIYSGRMQRLFHGGGQSAHVIVVALRGVVGILPAAMEGTFSGCKPQASALAVKQRNADTERSEIHSRNDRTHGWCR